MPRLAQAVAVPALAALVLAGCGAPDSSPAAAPADAPAEQPEAALTVVASTNVYGAIASAVGGDRVEVISIIDDPAADPHSYESTPADAARVAEADVVVQNGGHYDEFMTGLVEASGRTPTVIDVVDVSGLEEAAPAADAPGTDDGHDHADGAHDHGDEDHAHDHGDDGHAHDHGDEGHSHDHGDEGHSHDHGAFNEHVWYDLNTASALAERMAADFGAVDAEGAEQYTSNADAFEARVAELVTEVQEVGATAPGARVAVTEPVPGYLLTTAGLTDATPPAFSQAIEEDTDPPAAVLAETLALFSGDPVRVLVVNSQTQTATTDQVRDAAEAAGVPVVEMSETLPEGSDDYLAWMQEQITALDQALTSGA